MMPPTPTPYFVITHPEILFPVLKTGFDRPPHPTQPYQHGQRYVRWRIAQIALQFPGPHVAAQHTPDLRAWQALSHGDHAQGSKVGHQRALTALFDCLTRPLRDRQRLGHPLHGLGRGGSIDHAYTRRFATPPRPRGHRCGRPLPPRPACHGALPHNTTAYSPPPHQGSRYPAQTLRHTSPNDSARSRPDTPPGSLPTPMPGSVANVMSAGTPHFRRRSAYAASSTHSCGT